MSYRNECVYLDKTKLKLKTEEQKLFKKKSYQKLNFFQYVNESSQLDRSLKVTLLVLIVNVKLAKST